MTLRSIAKTMMILAISCSAGTALAQGRPMTLQMSCQMAANLVASRGAMVLNTGPYTYDRYVSGQQACLVGQTTRPAYVPAGDTDQCFIGYTCVETERRGHRN